MAKISLDLLERVRIPLVIGTAGHSDIRTAETVENAVKSVFEEITKPVPHTPILLLSPLGIGSERLIARVALDHLKKPPGVKIIVPMPVPRWLYESDFQSQADRKLFEGATYHFAVHLAKENTEENIVETRARSLQDKAAGVYVTRHCQILIALWNGQAGDTKQGDAPRLDWTSELVRFQLDGTSAEVRQRMIPCERELLHSQYELAEWGPVYCVPVQRESDSTETTQPGCSPFVLLYPKVFKEDGAAGHYEKVFKNLDQYNKDVENSGGLHEGYCASKKELLPVGDAMELSPALQFLLDRYAVADALANRFQAKFRHRQEAVHSLIWCALLFFELFAYFLERERGKVRTCCSF